MNSNLNSNLIYNNRMDIINFHFIDYIIKSYVPEIQSEERRININLFRQAMTHFSMTMAHEELGTYERLEYLGDAIFHMIVTEYIYDRYDTEGVGFLTKLRIKLERGDSMVQLTEILELDKYIQHSSDIFLNDHIMEDVFESFIGAFYLNFGMRHVRKFIIGLLEKHKDFSALIAYEDNYKDMLLQYFHKAKWGHPKYIKEMNPNGFFVSMVKNPFGEILGRGMAKSKKKSEQIASKKALMSLGIDVDDEIGIDWINKINIVTDGNDENDGNDGTDVDISAKTKNQKKNADVNKLSIFNPNNKLMKKTTIQNILQSYNVYLPPDRNMTIKIFYEAMTHKSYLKRKNLTEKDKKSKEDSVPLQSKSNERLQFLGDSIIHFVIGEHLYQTYKTRDEGFMTRLRCKLENRDSLFYLSKQSGIDRYLLLSQTIDVLHGRNNVNIIRGGLEAFVGAIYLELGLKITREFVLSVIRTELDIDKIAESETNYKEIISQLFINNKLGYPVYEIIKTEGPDHAKIFTMGLYHNNILIARGKALSKRKAEQIASKKMYRLLQKDKNKLEKKIDEKITL